MSRTVMPFHAEDISALARALKRELDQREKPPGHLEWLNILARATGYKNYQHLKAVADAGPQPAGRYPAGIQPASPSMALPVEALPPRREAEPEPVDPKRVDAAARCFDAAGVLMRWPGRTNLQRLCLWRLWSAFPAGRDLTEPEVNSFLKARNAFGDHVLIRREMVNNHMLERDRDCRRYRRLEQHPPAEALAVIRAVEERAVRKPLHRHPVLDTGSSHGASAP